MALVWLGDKAIASDISDGDAVHFWRGALPFGGLMQGASSVSEGSENKVENGHMTILMTRVVAEGNEHANDICLYGNFRKGVGGQCG